MLKTTYFKIIIMIFMITPFAGVAQSEWDYFATSNEYAKMNNWAKVIEYCDKAIEINPKFSRAYNHRAQAKYKLNYSTDAVLSDNNLAIKYIGIDDNDSKYIYFCERAFTYAAIGEVKNDDAFYFKKAASDITTAIDLSYSSNKCSEWERGMLYFNRAMFYSHYESNLNLFCNDMRKSKELGYKVTECIELINSNCQ